MKYAISKSPNILRMAALTLTVALAAAACGTSSSSTQSASEPAAAAVAEDVREAFSQQVASSVNTVESPEEIIQDFSCDGWYYFAGQQVPDCNYSTFETAADTDNAQVLAKANGSADFSCDGWYYFAGQQVPDCNYSTFETAADTDNAQVLAKANGSADFSCDGWYYFAGQQVPDCNYGTFETATDADIAQVLAKATVEVKQEIWACDGTYTWVHNTKVANNCGYMPVYGSPEGPSALAKTDTVGDNGGSVKKIGTKAVRDPLTGELVEEPMFAYVYDNALGALSEGQ